VHELLVAAGPPPELPPQLQKPVEPEKPRDNVSFLPRRRTGLLLGIAAAIALTAFLGGFISGERHGSPFNEVAQLPMHGTTAASKASALLYVGKRDSAGNWPLKVDVKNLAALPKGEYYEMFISRGANARAASCGTFRAAGNTDGLRLNAPFSLQGVTGWVVTLERPGSGKHPIVLTT
jgi:hypothetical protein